MQTTNCFIGLGTNQGDKAENLRTAQLLIHEKAGDIIAASSIYQTAAWGIEDQDTFFNQVLQIDTPCPPMHLLNLLLGIEEQMGRVRAQKWGPRLIDIDILFYGTQIIEYPELLVPHPFLSQRNFVLVPLVELAPNFRHPINGFSMRELLEKSPDPLKVERFLGETK